ncbi:MAG: tRNA epoxyqueuosine(34) reductase QueG, partial [Thiobacillaceae bacterium]|nr:tRNA epoxyqueuosine(34) reductase QueG [Thiobacillaceae bacterium]
MALQAHAIIALMHDLDALARQIKSWGRELGFAAVGITDCDLSAAE